MESGKELWRELASKGQAHFKPKEEEEEKEENFLLLDGVLAEYSMEMLHSYVSKYVTEPKFHRDIITYKIPTMLSSKVTK